MHFLLREREQKPRFAQPGTFEFEFSSRWKALDEMEKQQRDQVDRNIKEAKEKLEAELESAKHEHQLMLMRQGVICDLYCSFLHMEFNTSLLMWIISSNVLEMLISFSHIFRWKKSIWTFLK